MAKEETDLTYKLILIGDSSVGKTCIFKKINTGEFTEKSISTIGMDRRTLFFDIKIKENNEEITKKCQVHLWDTAGQERFRSVTNSYYKSSQGLILIYDITKKETYDNLDSWIDSVKSSLGDNNDYMIVLLGNKLDIAQASPESREVTTEEGETKSKENGIYWGGECSAKDFTEEQLKELFTKFTQEIYKKVGYHSVKGQVVSNKPAKKKSKC